MKEICAYVRRSEATVLEWIRQLDFPATKINGGNWESDTKLVNRWREKQIMSKDKKPKKKAIREEG
jgi:hypothetical protein